MSHGREEVDHEAAIVHVAAGRGCARPVHASTQVAAENSARRNTKNATYLEKGRLNQLILRYVLSSGPSALTNLFWDID